MAKFYIISSALMAVLFLFLIGVFVAMGSAIVDGTVGVQELILYKYAFFIILGLTFTIFLLMMITLMINAALEKKAKLDRIAKSERMF